MSNHRPSSGSGPPRDRVSDGASRGDGRTIGPTDAEIASRLTGLCTFLVQAPSFEEGDLVDVVLKRAESGDPEELSWLVLTVAHTIESRNSLTPGERSLGEDVVLIRSRLARTGGIPLDSMNREMDGRDPDALTLSDVRVLDRSPAR